MLCRKCFIRKLCWWKSEHCSVRNLITVFKWTESQQRAAHPIKPQKPQTDNYWCKLHACVFSKYLFGWVSIAEISGARERLKIKIQWDWLGWSNKRCLQHSCTIIHSFTSLNNRILNFENIQWLQRLSTTVRVRTVPILSYIITFLPNYQTWYLILFHNIMATAPANGSCTC